MKKLVLFFVLFNQLCVAQSFTKNQIETQAQKALISSLDNFRKFLSLPNDGNYKDQINTNLDFVKGTFENLDFKTQILISDGIPHLFAEKLNSKSSKTILFYLQIDGQPVDKATWSQADPFIPILKNKMGEPISWPTKFGEVDLDSKIFARSASDSKGPANCFITALSVLRNLKINSEYNIKVICDFQEELSSPTIAKLVSNNRKLLDADYLLVMDGTRHISNIPTLNFGARGIATISLSVFGAKEALHSGQYGNYAPNPAFSLARLLSSMKDSDGRVLISGYYDGIEITDIDKKEFSAMPENLLELNKRLGIYTAEKVGETYEEAMQFPTLNIRGMQAGLVGKKVTTTIPSEALAEIDIRLVVETEGEKWVNKVKEHIIKQGYYIIKTDVPTDEERAKYPNLAKFTYKLGSKPFKTPIKSEIGSWLGKAMNRSVDDYLNIRATGGSQPMASFIETLDIPAVSIRIPNPDNNIHASNENIRLGNYLEGIQMCLAILTQPF